MGDITTPPRGPLGTTRTNPHLGPQSLEPYYTYLAAVVNAASVASASTGESDQNADDYQHVTTYCIFTPTVYLSLAALSCLSRRAFTVLTLQCY